MSSRTSRKRKTSASAPASASKRAKWSKEQQKLLKQQIELGESIPTIARLFPEFTPIQVHSKVSNLKKQGVIKKIPSSGISPSLSEGSL